jgi:hypothetical protein
MTILEHNIPVTIHNKYEIEVLDKNNNVKATAVAYNSTNIKNYLSERMIFRITIIGTNRQRTKYLEPYLDKEGKPEEPLDYDGTNYWERNGEPNFLHTGYKTEVYFPPDGNKNNITSVRLLGYSVMSQANLQDVEGRPIILEYEENDIIHINIFIYFSVPVGIVAQDFMTGGSNVLYPVKFFNASNSIYCGCTGYNYSILNPRKRGTHRPYETIEDGFLPYPEITTIAITKNPIPRINTGKNASGNFVKGGIDNYQLFDYNEDLRVYKNSTTEQSSWKGLMRALVFPGVGLIDLLEKNTGPLRQGILLGNPVDMKDLNAALRTRPELAIEGIEDEWFIPQDYVENGDASLISMSKNPFYTAPVTVKRFAAEGLYEVAELDKSFFSDLITDRRYQRVMSFCQPLPLTNHYCACESIIPSQPGGDEYKRNYYGYIIEYGEVVEGKEPVYYTANYAVTGEVLTTRPYEADFDKVVFPYKLEYSYDGNTFETAVEFTNNSTPYVKTEFPTVSAPLWRITGGLSTGATIKAKTTHGDPYISIIAGNNQNGYDPYFLWVGYDGRDKNADGLNKYEIASRQNAPVFTYTNKGRKAKALVTKTPYLYHPNDTIFLSANPVKK